MKRSISIAMLSVLLLASGARSQKTPHSEFTTEEAISDLQHLGKLLRERWSWLEMREEQGLDLGVLERKAIAAVQTTPGRRGFLRALKRYVAALRDGHASATLPGVSLKEARKWPFSLVEAKEGITIDGVCPSLFSARTLGKGDLVLEIEGRPIEEFVRDAEAFQMASTPGARRFWAIFRMSESTTATSLRVKALRLGSREPCEVEIECPLQSAPVGRFSWRGSERREFKVLEEEVGYFRVGSFRPQDPGFGAASPRRREEIVDAQYDEFQRVFKQVAGKRGLILDLRGNPGGTDLLGQALVRHLSLVDPRYYFLASKIDGAWTKPHLVRATHGRGRPRFLGPLVCLIDERTFSVADNVATCLREVHPQVRFIGQPTGGGTGAPRSVVLPASGARVSFCTMRVYGPRGKAIEGRGVVPELRIQPTRKQRHAGEDPALDAALASLKSR